jgi:methyl-accepting chemotaxis protein
VRSLAGRSASAAREIKTLIEDSVAKVDSGARLVEESGTNLSEIVTSVQKVAAIISEISVASSEQTSGIEQVGRAVALMDEGVQQNAALVEEAAAASESIVHQVRDLNASVNSVSNDDVTEPAVAPRAQAQAAGRHTRNESTAWRRAG